MPVVIRGEEVSEVEVDHCQVTAFLTHESIGNDRIELDHISLKKDACFNINLDDAAAGWALILTGCGEMDGAAEQLTSSHIAYLPLGYSGGFTAAEESTRILLARIPDAARFDDAIADMPTTLQSVDWTREPVLQSEHDARSRIYMATRTLAGTDAFKGEMITFPPGAAGSAHHHEGAEHFKYVISGRGTALLNGDEIPLKAGDVIYHYEHEIHSSINESKEDFVFVEFFIPGPCKTVWVPGVNRCAWLPTGVDKQGRKPVREIDYHVHGQDGGI